MISQHMHPGFEINQIPANDAIVPGIYSVLVPHLSVVTVAQPSASLSVLTIRQSLMQPY